MSTDVAVFTCLGGKGRQIRKLNPWCVLFRIFLLLILTKMSTPKEMEFSENLTGDGGVSGDIGGDIFIPIEQEDDVGTLDEPVTTTLVRRLSQALYI